MIPFDLEAAPRLLVFPELQPWPLKSVGWWNSRSKWPLKRRHSELNRKQRCHLDEDGSQHCFCGRRHPEQVLLSRVMGVRK
jgi:hypothetical protein